MVQLTNIAIITTTAASTLIEICPGLDEEQLDEARCLCECDIFRTYSVGDRENVVQIGSSKSTEVGKVLRHD